MALKLYISKDRKPFKILVQGATFSVLPLTRSQDRDITDAYTEKTYSGGIESKTVRDEVVSAKAKVIIKGWSDDLQDADGVPIPYSSDAVDALLETYPELVFSVLAEARNIHAKRVEDAEKNS